MLGFIVALGHWALFSIYRCLEVETTSVLASAWVGGVSSNFGMLKKILGIWRVGHFCFRGCYLVQFTTRQVYHSRGTVVV